jgi:hypothetical protein
VAVERVNGERFTAVEPTPLLAACIADAREALRAAVTAAFPGGSVEAGGTLAFGPGTELSPSLVVRADGGRLTGLPDLVVEFRTESTGRYVLGPKRMVYSRFRVPEFWYVDPLRRRVAVLRSSGEEYAWPPAEQDVNAVLEPHRLPGVRVPVRALVSDRFAGRVIVDPADADWLEV